MGNSGRARPRNDEPGNAGETREVRGNPPGTPALVSNKDMHFSSRAEGSQLHWEQWGQLSGTLTVDEEDYELNLRGMRDRSIGIEWEGGCGSRGGSWYLKKMHVVVLSLGTNAPKAKGLLGLQDVGSGRSLQGTVYTLGTCR